MPKGVYKRTKEGNLNMSLARRGKVQSEEVKIKRGLYVTGEKHQNWKGEKAGYVPQHAWITRMKGTPSTCENCGKAGLKGHEIQWTNIDHKYRRVLADYIRMCAKCHRNYDYKNHLCNIGSRGGSVQNKIPD